MFKKIAFTMFSAAALGLLAVPAASAEGQVYNNDLRACQGEGNLEVAAAGGPTNLAYSCDTIYSVKPPVAGCSNPDGCLGTYYVLHTYTP